MAREGIRRYSRTAVTTTITMILPSRRSARRCAGTRRDVGGVLGAPRGRQIPPREPHLPADHQEQHADGQPTEHHDTAAATVSATPVRIEGSALLQGLGGLRMAADFLPDRRRGHPGCLDAGHLVASAATTAPTAKPAAITTAITATSPSSSQCSLHHRSRSWCLPRDRPCKRRLMAELTRPPTDGRLTDAAELLRACGRVCS